MTGSECPKIHVPLGGPEKVIPFLGKPSHWKQGRSAKALADTWFAANDIPPAVRAILSQAADLRDAQLVDAHLERKTSLEDGRGTPSQTDLLAVLGTTAGLTIMGVEAKVTESFGKHVRNWLDGGAGKADRLEKLCDRLGITRGDAQDLRYQLLHRTVATILEALRYRTSRAVMMVQSFCPDAAGSEDFLEFGRALGFRDHGIGRLSEERRIGDVALRLGWATDTPPPAKRPHRTVEWLTEFGRIRLSQHFFMRDFLYSEIASVHGFVNAPNDPELAVEAGRRLCRELLEPLQEKFGRIAIRSAYRSEEVNCFGNRMQKLKERGYTCASNEKNYAAHIWDRTDAQGAIGATACIVLPEVWDRLGDEPGGWQRLAWWIHDHLPYSHLEFFPKYWAFNIGWDERPARTIYSYAEPKGYLTQPGMPDHEGNHQELWTGLI